ncbi:putative gastrula zinc finger protein XlCGF57.1-like [Penaeus vannamei]|uniref:Putative gastrula zinc finger protein XlCGF57.1-like n=1 Tax=Penaeus vannamei TaxID=6689 RepID=A0A423TKS1_PENVA|nr:zinc finger protein with KRAB and SCAN domains 5-like [Penaeus vannamei]ROT77070.1 putative gastrula zinc finger protein XlCGF57.1-like [Penaeus vannamei]
MYMVMPLTSVLHELAPMNHSIFRMEGLHIPYPGKYHRINHPVVTGAQALIQTAPVYYGNPHQSIRTPAPAPVQPAVAAPTYQPITEDENNIVNTIEEKPYNCDQCGKQFAQKSHLTSHMQWHNREKKFECEVCNKRFSMESHLNGHMLEHSREKSLHATCVVKGLQWRIT